MWKKSTFLSQFHQTKVVLFQPKSYWKKRRCFKSNRLHDQNSWSKMNETWGRKKILKTDQYYLMRDIGGWSICTLSFDAFSANPNGFSESCFYQFIFCFLYQIHIGKSFTSSGKWGKFWATHAHTSCHAKSKQAKNLTLKAATKWKLFVKMNWFPWHFVWQKFQWKTLQCI